MKKENRSRLAILVVAAAVVAVIVAAAVLGGSMYATFWALVPPVIAIVLALVTKEAYSSLFIGVVIGAHCGPGLLTVFYLCSGRRP